MALGTIHQSEHFSIEYHCLGFGAILEPSVSAIMLFLHNGIIFGNASLGPRRAALSNCIWVLQAFSVCYAIIFIHYPLGHSIATF